MDYFGSLGRANARPAQVPADFNLDRLPDTRIVRTSQEKIHSIKRALTESFPALRAYKAGAG